MSELSVYKNNTLKFNTTIPTGDTGLSTTFITGATPLLTVKESASDSDTYISLQGTINNNIASFEVPYSANTISNEYVYNITLSGTSEVYTIAMNKYIIKDNVRF